MTAIAAAPLAVEHALAQEAPFEPTSRGFENQEDYAWWLHRLGNLTLLEEAINSRARKLVDFVLGRWPLWIEG